MALAALLCWLVGAVFFDFTERRIPNWLVLAGGSFGLIAALLAHQPLGLSWTDAVTGGLTAFFFLLFFYSFRLMGAGDVKFAGALGIWVGVMPLVPIWIGASMLAGIHAGLWLILRRWPVWPRLLVALSGIESREGDQRKQSRQIPYAAYLAIASMAWFALNGHYSPAS